MTELTPRDDVKKKVSEILKRVDQLLKAGQLDQAAQQLGIAKETDPKNVYIHAYEERITAMAKEREEMEVIESKRKEEEEARKKEEEAKRKVEEEKRRVQEEARRKVEEERRRKEEEQRRKEEGEQRKREEERRKREEEEERRREEQRKVDDLRRQKEKEREAEEETRRKIEARRKEWEEEEKPRPVREEPKPVSRDVSRPVIREEPPAKGNAPTISRETLEETKRKILEDRKKQGAPDLGISKSKAFGHAYDEGLEIYRKVLIEAWADGATSASEDEKLKSLRASLMILPEDHARLEKGAKIEAYSSAFRRAWSSGAISPESASSLAELRKKFKISLEEHEQIEAKLLWELRSSSQKAQIIVIDDDEKILTLISDTLQDAGYQTVTFTTSDQAFSYLQSNSPDLILSDINLETSTMGGFTFFEKVREIERLNEVPFIFLSGLTDEVLVRTGKELGVDDYLTKPFSEENLIATIKGKLKRLRQLRKSRQKK